MSASTCSEGRIAELRILHPGACILRIQRRKILKTARASPVLRYFAAFMLRPTLIWLLLLAGPALAAAQEREYLLEPYTYRQGLSDNRVRAVMQDEKGFVWVGTANGLNRFDGYSFWPYFPVKDDSTSISSSLINTIVKDRQGALWFGTGNGICRLRPGPWVFERVLTYPDLIKDKRYSYFENVYPDPQGRVWAVNSYGQLFCVFPDQRRYEIISVPKPGNPPASVPPAERQTLPRPVWVSACTDSTLLIGTNFGLFEYDPQRRSFQFTPVAAAWPFGLTHMRQAGPGTFWCATYKPGLLQVDLPSGRVAEYPESDQIPHAFLPIASDRLWVAGVAGLSEFIPAAKRAVKIKLPFEADLTANATCLSPDRDNAIWIGTDNGLVKYDPFLQGFHYTEVHRETSTIFENDIYDVLHLPADGRWYVASRQQHAIFVLDSQNRIQHRISTLPHIEPTRIFCDSKGRIWVTTRYQVLRLDRKTLRLTAVPTPPRRENRAGVIWSVAEDPRGRLWFGTSRDGIFIYDPERNGLLIPGPENGFEALRIYKVIVDRAGRFAWVATDNEGFYECDLNTMQFKRYSDETHEGLVNGGGLVQDNDGAVWIGTSQALLRYDPEAPKNRAFRSFTVADGLPMNFVEGGICDLQGCLWFGAGDRLVRIDPKNDHIKTFDYRYGASRTPFGYFDFNRSPDGELYAGGRRGFLRWRPGLLRDNHAPPTVVVTNLRALQKDIPAPTANVGRIWLTHDENTFRVEFAALNYTLSSDNLYQWKLEGYDKDWSPPSKQRQASYAHIPPGEYTLLVKAANNDGVWNQHPMAIRVTIIPAFWQTWWFQLLLIMLLGGAVYGVVRWQIQQVRERERLQSTFNQRLTEAEMSALRAQMNPHFVFNCLNSINRFILLNQPLVASQYLTKFARLIRLVLDNSKSEMISLEKELETLRLYIEMEAVRFEGRFQFDIRIDEAVDAGSMDIPPMLIQPYVENAIWHGLMHKKNNEGQLDIAVRLDNHDLVIEVTDNGVGRAAAQALKSKSASEHKSHGMAVTAERLKLLSNLYNRNIHARVRDLVLPDGSPAGTQVVLTIPALG